MADHDDSREPVGSGLRIGRLFGVDIFVDASLLIIFAIITFQLGAIVFPNWHPDWSASLVWLTALGAATLFFASVLAHELSHAIVGRAQGIPIRRVTLFLFGGMAHMEGEPGRPRSEFLMAIVGPVVSIVIGFAATACGLWIADATVPGFATAPQALARALGPGATLLLWLGPINVIIGLFNLVPGFPLDGGRVARSALWWSTGDFVKATRWASYGGRAFAWILMGIGVIDLLGGAFASGLWLLLIGWFLGNAARASYEQLLFRRTLRHTPVARMMYRAERSVHPTLTVDAFVRDHVLGADQSAVPVVEDGHLRGLVTLTDVRALPSTAWPHTPVSEIMTPASELYTLTPDADADEALAELGRRDVGQLPVVVEGDHIVGLVRRRDLVKWVALHDIEGAPRAA